MKQEVDRQKAAQRGLPSYVWRAGQERRWRMIEQAAGERLSGCVFEDGSGVGTYLERMAARARFTVGLEVEMERVCETRQRVPDVVCGVGEHLPFAPAIFDLVLSHEVLEHVNDDRAYLREVLRSLRPGGRLVLFCPNRGYPVETHGIFWRGQYRFGNIPLVNYLPRRLRDRLAPHVRVYMRDDLNSLLQGLPGRVVHHTVIFGAYDNIIARRPRLGRLLRGVLQFLEKTPLRVLGLSHFWVVEKLAAS